MKVVHSWNCKFLFVFQWMAGFSSFIENPSLPREKSTNQSTMFSIQLVCISQTCPSSPRGKFSNQAGDSGKGFFISSFTCVKRERKYCSVLFFIPPGQFSVEFENVWYLFASLAPASVLAYQELSLQSKIFKDLFLFRFKNLVTWNKNMSLGCQRDLYK